MTSSEYSSYHKAVYTASYLDISGSEYRYFDHILVKSKSERFVVFQIIMN